MQTDELVLCDHPESDGNNSTLRDPVLELEASVDTSSDAGRSYGDVFDSSPQTPVHYLDSGRTYRKNTRKHH